LASRFHSSRRRTHRYHSKIFRSCTQMSPWKVRESLPGLLL
jgi:hypothetical protein